MSRTDDLIPGDRASAKGGDRAIVVSAPRDIFRYVSSLPGGTQGSTLVLLVALGSVFVDFYDLGAFSIGAVQLQAQFHLVGLGLSLVTAAAPGGAVLGGLIGGRLSDRLGRLPMLLVDLLLFFFCALGSAVSPNAVVLGLFRVGVGLGIGLDIPVALAFVSESRGLRNKSRVVNSWQMISTGGSVLLFLLMTGMLEIVGPPTLWRWAVGLGALFALVVLVLRFLFLSESPLWLAAQGRLDEAVELLNSRFGARLVVPARAQGSDGAVPVPEQRSILGPYVALFRPPWRARTTMISIVSLAEATEYFAIGFYTPLIVQSLLGKNLVTTLLGSAVIAAIGELGALGCFLLTERLGFRGLGRIGFAITLASLLVVGSVGKSVPALVGALFIALFNFGHQFGPGTIASSMGSLSYPTEVRGSSGGWTQAMIRVGTLIGSFVFPLLLTGLGLEGAVLVIASAPFLGLVTILLARWDPVHRDVDADEGIYATPAPSA